MTDEIAKQLTDPAGLKAASGFRTRTYSRLTAFLYHLLRDHLPFGRVQKVLEDVPASQTEWRLCNGYSAQYAEFIAANLCKGGTPRLADLTPAACLELYAVVSRDDDSGVRVRIHQGHDAAFEAAVVLAMEYHGFGNIDPDDEDTLPDVTEQEIRETLATAKVIGSDTDFDKWDVYFVEVSQVGDWKRPEPCIPEPPGFLATQVRGVAFQAQNNPLYQFADPSARPPAGLVVFFPGLVGDQITAMVTEDQEHVESEHLIGTIGWCEERKRWVVTTLMSKAAIDKVDFS